MNAPDIDHHERIVKTKLKSVNVQACPGGGKTTTCGHRIGHLITDGVRAHDILVLSFSDDAVGEVRRKLDELAATTPSRKFANNARHICVQTAHAFALSVVKMATPNVKVVDNAKSRQLLAQAIRKTLVDARAKLLWKSVPSPVRKRRIKLLRQLLSQTTLHALFLSAIAYTHAANLTLVTTVSMTRFKRLSGYIDVINSVVRRYAAAKQLANYIDYGDMLTQACSLLELQPGLVRFKHVLVDEYQDSSPAQTLVLKVLAENCGCSVMVFGDRDQNIYGFAGNRYTALSAVLNGVVEMPLPVSHRLTREVAALASAVAGHDSEKRIVSHRQGVKPRLISNSGLTSQTHQVVADILRLIDSGTALDQIAVLARTRDFLRPVEQRLLAHGIPTQRLGVKRDIGHCLSTLRLVRLVERSARLGHKIDEASIRQSMRKITVAETRWPGAVQRLRIAVRATSLDGRFGQCADAYMHLLGGIRANTEIQHELNRWEPMCRGYPDAASARQAFKKIAGQHHNEPVGVGVVTANIHAAKGREWNHVMVVGLAHGQLPYIKALDDAQALEEERRVLYVAISRARETLHLYYAPVTHAPTGQRFKLLSQLLAAHKVSRLLAMEYGPDVPVSDSTPTDDIYVNSSQKTRRLRSSQIS
jgi:DNA helicase II / ATP-dependent DNA helicase PcrA